MMRVSGALWLACACIASPIAAELVPVDFNAPGDGLLTRDMITGLEWLDLSVTHGLSFNEVAAQTEVGGSLEGFRHATREEVVLLWQHAGLVDIDLPGYLNYTAANYPGALNLFELVGGVISFPNAPLARGVTATLHPFPSSLLVMAQVSLRPWEETAEARTNGAIAPFLALPDTGSWLVRAGVRRVPLDIRPGSCPNPIQPESGGVLPVGLVAGPEFDPLAVDLSSLELARADGVGGAVLPLAGPPGPSTQFEDVSSPAPLESCTHEEIACDHMSPDGQKDWLLFFDLQEVAELLTVEPPPQAVVELVLSGRLLDGTPFAGQDCVVVLYGGG